MPGTFTAYTLGIRPASEVTTQRFSKGETWNDVAVPKTNGTEMKGLTSAKGLTSNVKATVAVDDACKEVGFHLRHNSDLSTRTTIFFRPADEFIVIDRSKSTSDGSTNTAKERGPFTLFTLDNGGDGEERENFELEVFWDGDILEIFANGRFALTTLVYTAEAGALGVSLYVEGGEGSAVFDEVVLSDL